MLPQDLIVDLVIRYGFQLLGALIIIALGLVAARWLGALADRALQRETASLAWVGFRAPHSAAGSPAWASRPA